MIPKNSVYDFPRGMVSLQLFPIREPCGVHHPMAGFMESLAFQGQPCALSYFPLDALPVELTLRLCQINQALTIPTVPS